jgi:predicted DNA-binding protein YlxM (UPF0122 family)
MNLVSTTEAAQRKGVSRQAILDAIKRGVIDGEQIHARTTVVRVNKKFEAWGPVAVRQKAGKARAKKAQREAKKKKSR